MLNTAAGSSTCSTEKYPHNENYNLNLILTDKMRFTKYLFSLILISSCFLAHAQQQGNTLNLQQCIATAVKNNLTVQQDSITAQQNRIGFLQAEENMLPNISGNASRNLASGRTQATNGSYITSSQTTDSYNLNGNITIFNGLALQKAVKQASLSKCG